MSNTKASILPQEIINLIVDEVASDCSPETLRACALVSRSFSSPSRRQLFSEIEIVLDETIEPRAKRLLKVLKRGENIDLMAFIRSLKVILVPLQRQPASSSSIFSHPLQKAKQIATSIARNFPRENYLLKLLSLFVHAPLTSFALDGRRGYPILIDNRTNEVVQQLCTISSLKSLQISKIYNFDMTLVGEIIRANTLQELSVIAVSQHFSAGDIVVDNHAEISSRIEKLDIRRLPYPGVFRILGRSTDPLLPTPYPFVSFSRLHTLVISISSQDPTISIIWGFILGVAGTLESLEIEDLRWQEHIQLSQLTSLRNLKLTSIAFDFEEGFGLNKKAICQLLSPSIPLSPIGIRSLSIELNVHKHLLINSAHTPYTFPAWSELDNILMETSFVNMQYVDISIQFFFYIPPSTTPKHWQSHVNFEDARFLPLLSTHPSIQFQFKTNTICTPK